MEVTLTGHFLGAEDGLARFAPDLQESATWGDQRFRELMDLIGRSAADQGLELPPIDEPPTSVAAAPERLDLSGFGVVILASGFRPDYRSWLPWLDAFDELGFPLQTDGVSTVVPGLFFMGVPFLRTRGERRRAASRCRPLAATMDRARIAAGDEPSRPGG